MGSNEPLGKLGLGHFQRKERNRLVLLYRHVLGDVGDECRFADRRTGGQDNQVRRLEPAGLFVEIAKTGLRAGGLQLAAYSLLEALMLVEKHVAHCAKVTFLLLVGDPEQKLLGPLRKLAGACFTVSDPGFNRLSGLKQPPQMGRLLDYLGMEAGVTWGRRFLGQFGHVIAATGFFDLPCGDQRLGYGQRVACLVCGVEVMHDLIDSLMPVEIEVARLELYIVDNPVDRRVIGQHRAEDLLLGIDVVGRYLGYFLFLFRDDRLDRGDGATCHFDVDHVGTDLMDRNIETNLLAVNLDAAGITDCFGNFLGRD